MRMCLGLILLIGVLGCEPIDESEESTYESVPTTENENLSCDCAVVIDRATPTYTCTASMSGQDVYLCEDGEAGLDCVQGNSTSWSNDDLTCESVFCVTTDESECQADCSCTDERS